MIVERYQSYPQAFFPISTFYLIIFFYSFIANKNKNDTVQWQKKLENKESR
jgi:hypothetical protein